MALFSHLVTRGHEVGSPEKSELMRTAAFICFVRHTALEDVTFTPVALGMCTRPMVGLCPWAFLCGLSAVTVAPVACVCLGGWGAGASGSADIHREDPDCREPVPEDPSPVRGPHDGPVQGNEAGGAQPTRVCHRRIRVQVRSAILACHCRIWVQVRSRIRVCHC